MPTVSRKPRKLAIALPVDVCDVTARGFRSTYRHWAAEQTNYHREVAKWHFANTIGALLAHGAIVSRLKRPPESPHLIDGLLSLGEAMAVSPAGDDDTQKSAAGIIDLDQWDALRLAPRLFCRKASAFGAGDEREE